MFKKILVANRGEIALRIIRACRELGIKTGTIYSEADRDSLHVKYADEAFCVGSAQTSESYLNIPNIISTAEILGVDAIHPGYGFLAENVHFAEVCEACGFVFIGPSSKTIKVISDKSKARHLMKMAGIPVLPGTNGDIRSDDDAFKMADEIGFPLMIKAKNGGGGRGIRVAHDKDEFKKVLPLAKAEARSAFGNEEIYLEKYIKNPRHIEVQILSDKKGEMTYLGERDCSLQRKNQKVIEESPSCAVDANLRKVIGEAALKAAQAVDYTNLGTVEFLLDENKNFYFIEMNARIQVEHPVTEIIANIDLMKEQILLADGKDLDFPQEKLEIKNHAIQCRISAENPERNFAPSPGTIDAIHLPGGPGIRIDTHIFAGYTVPSFYDSLLVKLITWGSDRNEAIVRMRRALDEIMISGVETTIPLLRKIIDDDNFLEGKVNTSFIHNYIISKEGR